MSAAREADAARSTTAPERACRAGGDATTEPLGGPDVRVVRGAPAAEELAALLVVWARLTAAGQRPAAGRAGGRGAAAHPPTRPFAMTGVPAPGADAWRRGAWTS